MVQINIEKKHLFILLIFLSLFTIALVIAINPTTKPNPGHASNEVMVNIGGTDKTLQAAIDDGSLGGGKLGVWESKTGNIVYQAPTDGFALAYTDRTNYDVAGYTDSSNPPTTLRTRNSAGYYAGNGVSFPVRKGDYWKVVFTLYGSTGTTYVYWIPSGN